MAQKRKKIGPVYLFLICIGCTATLVFFMVPGAGKVVAPKPAAYLTDVPTVFIREDTCEALLKNFCVNHGNVKYEFKPLGNQCEINIVGFGANKEQFYNNHRVLASVNGKGFTIKTGEDAVNAIFTRKSIHGVFCVELPSDVLFALMKQHPLIK